MRDLQLEVIAPGYEICTISKDGKALNVFTVGEFSTLHGKFRLIRDNKHAGLIPINGAGYYAMYPKDTGPHFYYSANPEHIAMVKNAKRAAKNARDEKENQTKEDIEYLKKEINALLEKYNATLEIYQNSGDNQGVELELCLSIGNQSINIG